MTFTLLHTCTSDGIPSSWLDSAISAPPCSDQPGSMARSFGGFPGSGPYSGDANVKGERMLLPHGDREGGYIVMLERIRHISRVVSIGFGGRLVEGLHALAYAHTRNSSTFTRPTPPLPLCQLCVEVPKGGCLARRKDCEKGARFTPLQRVYSGQASRVGQGV